MRRLIPLLLTLAVLGAAPLAAAQDTVSGGAFSEPVVFRPHEGTLLHIAGRGPYRGEIEVRRSSGGLVVVNELGLESYVMGIQEVPGSWPMEALKAQAVAARTYALWEKERGGWRARGFDICATVACQVYAGAAAERGERGRRLVEAVRATEGEVLLHDGRPILARYHSSSGGRTLPNEFVYPSSGPRPYLRGVEDPGDAASPLHSWTVDFPHDVMEAILDEAFGLPGRLLDVSNDQEARRALVETDGGAFSRPTPTLRRLVSEHAPRLFPDDYPSPRNDGLPLPLTLPSSRFDVERIEGGFRFHGRGYGHGVGMSQWGAKGQADRGETYDRILASYYGGITPSPRGEGTTLRAGIILDTDEVRVSADGPFSVHSGDELLAEHALGTWTSQPGRAGTVVLEPPPNVNLPLVLSGATVPDGLVAGSEEPLRIPVRFVLSKAAQMEVVLWDAEDGAVSRVRRVFETGPAVLPLEVPEGRGGTYRVTLLASDGTEQAAEELTVEIRSPRRGVGTLLFLLLFAAAVYMVWRSRSLRRAPPAGTPADSVSGDHTGTLGARR